MKVAVMQPYFYPYGGYFRLIAAVDLFILFDCVQFPRRGRVHRTEVPDGAGGRRWLTLPLAKQPQTTRIDHLAFAPGARTVQPPSSRSEQNAPRKSSEMTWSAVIGGGVDA